VFTGHRPPTDFELLQAIYTRHRGEYDEYVKKSDSVLVPIDIHAIAGDLGVDVNSVFGRLYHHLEPLYGQQKTAAGGPRKVFFTPISGNDRDCVNLPLLEAVFAGLWQQRRPLDTLGRICLHRNRDRFARRVAHDCVTIDCVTIDCVTIARQPPLSPA
jgi:hypothetical protein